jgi:hypothetical protein
VNLAFLSLNCENLLSYSSIKNEDNCIAIFNSAAGLEDIWRRGIVAALTGNFGSRVLPSRPGHSVPEEMFLGMG